MSSKGHCRNNWNLTLKRVLGFFFSHICVHVYIYTYIYKLLNNEYSCCQAFRDRADFLSSTWCRLSSVSSPDKFSNMKQEITPSKESWTFLPHSPGQPLKNTGFILLLPKKLAFPCPPVAKIKDVSYCLRMPSSFKTPAMFWQNMLLSPQIEQMSLCPTV